MSDQQPVAIVGVGAILPDALDAPAFWQNIRTGWSSIREVPPDRWDPRLYYDPDPSVPDKTYSKIGAWVQGFKLDPPKMGLAIPPRVLDEMEEAQKWSLAACHQALVDYGYPRRQLEPTRVAVILGNLMSGERHYLTAMRVRLPEFQAALEAVPAFRDLPAETQKALVDGMRDRIRARIPTITEDTLPGELANVIAGRVANLFNFSGPNFIVDAACATSLAAIQTAIQGLYTDQYDAVLTGGVDRNMGPDGFVKFCKIGALSPDGSRPYADGANGFVMGEGAAIFLLKRLADAERDGDRIYAVIRGIGASSDGKGKGITAPNPAGQVRAIERAWKNAGISPETASLIEGHGTATRVGDVVEAGSLNTLFSSFGLPVGKIALGSVKSNVGHLKAAAGAVALLKTIYALHDRILPPSINFERPNPQIDFVHSPFQVNTLTRPWEIPSGEVRRAGISAFGFGGTNFHMVVEEYIPGLLTSTNHPHPVSTWQPAPADQPGLPPVPAQPSLPAAEASPTKVHATIGNSSTKVPAEERGIFFLGAQTSGELRLALADSFHRLKQGWVPETSRPTPEDLKQPERLAMDYAGDLEKRVEKALKALETDAPNGWQSLTGQGIFRGHGSPGKVAFLFPGQGSQYANMLRDLAAREPVVDQTFSESDSVMTPILGRSLTSYIFADDDVASLASAEAALKDTVITQPAVLTANVALLRLLTQSGFTPDLVAGHSLGEYAALVAAGVLSFSQALEVVSNRGRAMAKVSLDDNGCMAAVSAPLPEIERILKTIDGYVVIANINSPLQSVIGGTTPAIDAALAAFDAAGYQAVKIPVSHAFHTRIVAPASQALRETITRMDLQSPVIPVIANVTGLIYPAAHDEVLNILAQQVASPVQFVRSMETLYNEGARVFVEVGPKRVLTALAVDNLKEYRDVTILATNHPRKGGLASYNEALAGLYAAGVVPRSSRRPTEGKAGQSTPAHLTTHTLPISLQPGMAQSVQFESTPTESRISILDSQEIKAFILAEVSEKTGYPTDMLDLGLDLEGDLGIDTVKQAELFAAMREHYDIARPDDLRLSDYNTLAKVIGFFEKGVSDKARAQEQAAVSKSNGDSRSGEESASVLLSPEKETRPYSQHSAPDSRMIRRLLPVPVIRPRLDVCLETGISLGQGERVLVVAGASRLGSILTEALEARQVGVTLLDGIEGEEFENQFAALATGRPYEGIYFLPSFDSEPPFTTLSPADWQDGLDQCVYRLFRLLQKLPGKPFLVCATSMGGLHGFGLEDTGAVLAGGTRGLAKAVARERNGVMVKVVDFGPETELNAVAGCLVAETLFDPGTVEIGYRKGARFGIEVKEESLTGKLETELPENSIYLVSGGTGGITGPVLLDLAQAARGTFYLMGRLPLPDRADPLLARLAGDREGVRKEWLRISAEDGIQPAPSSVEARLARLERAASTLDLIRQLEGLGSQAHYLPCDVTDFQAVCQAVRDIHQAEGRVDMLFHAAGYETSRKLESKTADEVHQTLAVKATGFYNLVKALESEGCLPRQVLGFASVAGRFGNLGQTDYSAANDLLARLVCGLRALHPEIQSLCLDWGPWAEVGMASRGRVPAMMKMAGVDMLPPAQAAPLVRRELLAARSGEVIFAGSLGRQEAQQEPAARIKQEKAAQVLAHYGNTKILGNLVRWEGADLTLDVDLDPNSEPFLTDHALNKIPVLPGVVGIEAFYEIGRCTAALFTPEAHLDQVLRMEDVHFLLPAKFYRDQPRRFTWNAHVEAHKEGLQANITLESDLIRHNHAPQLIRHFTGRVILAPVTPTESFSSTVHPTWQGSSLLGAEEIYRLYFHGPAFQVLDGVSSAADSLVGILRKDRPPLTNGLASPASLPALVELFMQTAGAWQIGKMGALGLPAELARVTLSQSVIDGEVRINPETSVFAEVTPHPEAGGLVSFSGRVIDSQGCLYLEIEGYRTALLPYTAGDDLLVPFQKLVGA